MARAKPDHLALAIPTPLLSVRSSNHVSPSRLNRSSSSDRVLNLPPSPPRLPLIGNLHQLGRFPHRSLRALSEKYGPLLLLHLGNSPTRLVSYPDLVKEIAKNHDVAFSDRPKTTASDVLAYGGKDMAFSPYNEYWKQTRRICALELFSHKRVQSFQSVREEEVERLVDRVRKVCLISGSSSTCCVNLSHILRSTTNNIISRCVIGQRYDTEDELAGSGGTSRFEELAKRLSLQFSAICSLISDGSTFFEAS